MDDVDRMLEAMEQEIERQEKEEDRRRAEELSRYMTSDEMKKLLDLIKSQEINYPLVQQPYEFDQQPWQIQQPWQQNPHWNGRVYTSGQQFTINSTSGNISLSDGSNGNSGFFT